MSLASIKQKEAKGRKNALPKLRTLLGNPYKQHCPVLPENELLEFQNILKTAIADSDYTEKTFPKHVNIHLGLESSLRAINGCRFSCVFVSLSLRPSHLVRLIGTCAARKISNAPIYAQPKLEELTLELFGIKTMALVLPLDLKSISPDLAKWVDARKKPDMQKKTCASSKVETSKKIKQIIEKPKAQVLKSMKTTVAVEHKENQFSGDYISCSTNRGELKLDQVDEQLEKEDLEDALSILAIKAQSGIGPIVATTANEISTPAAEPMEVQEQLDLDDFLPVAKYQSLTWHQIQSNPNKKPKKKRNKKKQT